ncbi:MAG: hypothetical protein CMQ80_02575 [Gammaproteobacteria bacterium]|nr:hypothetical protein [Gammaproteobacteria bacterium]
MKKIIGKIDSLFLGVIEEELIKRSVKQLEFRLDGVIGDRHAGFERVTWEGDDKQVANTLRRNERQWSAVSSEELDEISEKMNLRVPLNAGDIGANFCVSGANNFSKLPKGTIFKFDSGVELIVEEYNPPCLGMSKNLAQKILDKNGNVLDETLFLQVAKYLRGLVGVVEVPGIIHKNDEFLIIPYTSPRWAKNQ